MDGGAWWAPVLALSKSRTRLSDFTFFQTPVVQGAAFFSWEKSIDNQSSEAYLISL